MRTTIKMIAERAGVSIGTVDRVLHDRPYVKAEVRERVLQVLEELDYHPNRMASALATSGTPRHLALVQPEWEKGYVQDEMEAGVTRFLEEYRDYNVTLDVRTYAREDEAACRRLLREAAKDALRHQRTILVPQSEPQARERLEALGVRIVEPTPEQLAELKRKTRPVWELFGDSVPQELIELVLETQK